jgi:transposase
MYHKIKVTRKKHTVRNTADILKVATGTVQKYSKMSLKEAASYVKQLKRPSQFDIARNYIEQELELYHKIKSTKLLRKIKVKYPEITAGERALRNYIKPLKEKYKNRNIRNYRPVFATIPGEQVQVDPGEYKVLVDASGRELKIYFVVFVFSYSRMMYVSFQTRPYNTDDFIKAHLEAFHYFGGVAREYVYDQTKLVVIQEKYREVWFNQKFHQFALQYEFLPVVCEGYDPESKGKVERAVRYVKEDFLYGDIFADIEAVRRESRKWLQDVANVRIHGTTGRQPVEMFEEEKTHLNTRYLAKTETNSRSVDKTGLLSYQGNKYSVPLPYQRKRVIVEESGHDLIIRDLETGREITRHSLSEGKGLTILNTNHYRDFRKSIEEITGDALGCLSKVEGAERLVERIKAENPKIIRDQLRGVIKLAKRYPLSCWTESMPTLLNLPSLRASLVEAMLEKSDRENKISQINKTYEKHFSKIPESSSLDRSLDKYMEVLNNA